MYCVLCGESTRSDHWYCPECLTEMDLEKQDEDDIQSCPYCECTHGTHDPDCELKNKEKQNQNIQPCPTNSF